MVKAIFRVARGKHLPKVSIIILNWNGKEHLPECLTSLKNQTFQDFETILVDNGSKDGSQQFIKQFFPWVRLVELEENLGFAGGNVAGYRQSMGSFIVTLNNDTVVDIKWLEELVNVADQNPGTGMVASRICSYFDNDTVDSLGMKICLDGMSRGYARGKKFSSLKNVPDDILMPSACAALYRRQLIEQTGFFDESFFAYCEDSDLGLRARIAGWGAKLAVNSVVYHKYSATAGSFSPFKLYLVERNHFWTVLKTFPPILLLLLPLTTLFRYVFQALVTLRGAGSGHMIRQQSDVKACLIAVIRGFWHGLRNPFTMIQKRREFLKKCHPDSFRVLRLILKHRMSFSELLDAGD